MPEAASEENNPLVEMTPGQILTEASVADFISAMGLAVAQAQQELDRNSIAQIGVYTEPHPGLDNKSLLQLGLAPPFYHYQYADLAVSLQLTMKVGRTSSFGLGASLDFGLNTGSTLTKAREAQVKVGKAPASIKLDGKVIGSSAGTGDPEAAAEQIAVKLRKDQGPFERATIRSEHSKVAFQLQPEDSKNPVRTEHSVVFSPSSGRSAVLRISEKPTGAETFKLKTNISVEVNPAGSSDKKAYAKAVAKAIGNQQGFKATLVGEAGPGAGRGVIGLALFDVGSSTIKKDGDAAVELGEVARILNSAPDTRVEIIGYASTTADDESNLDLSKSRAEKVKEFLLKAKVNQNQIVGATGRGETRWSDAGNDLENQQFRRVEVVLVGSSDLFILVTGDLIKGVTPDKSSSGSSGNGFVMVSESGQSVDSGTKIKFGNHDAIGIKGDKVDEPALAKDSPQAYAYNLAKEINARSDALGVRATRTGSVVSFASKDDAVYIDLLTLSTEDIKLEKNENTEISKPLAAIKPGTQAKAQEDKPKVSMAFGATVDYRTSRQFDQTVTGNSSISAHLVAVPAPAEFLEAIKGYLAGPAP